MATQYQQVPVRLNDRWDLISFRTFGNEYYAEEFLKINQQYAYVAIFNQPGQVGLLLNKPNISTTRQVSTVDWADTLQIA